jgi:hypothetical protein
VKNGHAECECKVGRVIEEYGLSDVNDELAARRRGETGDPESLRDLVDYFNRAVLRSAMADADLDPLDGEVENTYRLLTDDEVSGGDRLRVRRRLERDGVELASVESSFVSHPTIGRHLEECLGVEKTRESGDRIRSAKERIFKMQSRTEAVVENTLAGLASAGLISAGNLAVTVDLGVTCQDCGAHAGAGAFVDREGCDCERE